MNDTHHRTDTLNPFKTVICGKQIKHWIEFQLLDELGEPLANVPYRAVNEATCVGLAKESTGRSDAQGVIRIEGLFPIPLTLLLEANPLAELLQGRRLRAVRPEPDRPNMSHRFPMHQAQRPGFSPLEAQASAAGQAYHYLRIGQVCDGLPEFDPPLTDPAQLPGYHFPDPGFSGFTVDYEGLDRRHLLELCPLRAWSLTLHHQPNYSLVNAYNLALMSILAYSTMERDSLGSAEEFFLQQCLDLSRTPRVWDNGQNLLCIVTDVPFNQRYTRGLMLDTKKAVPPEGDTQLFYAISATQVLVAWRGTEMDGFADLKTDATFRPVQPQVESLCEPKARCADLTPEGSVHLGFRDAFDLANRIYARDLAEIIHSESFNKDLFICGHSLGGALGLVHAAALKARNPLLYTYGMPRTFTLKAVQGLSEIVHFRHVNDIDPIPSVPPEAALDNHLYDLYGPLGTTLGFGWSLLQLLASQVFKHGDPFCHHGEIAMFFRAEQHMSEQGSRYPAYRNKEGLGAPYYTTVTRRLMEKTKLYLVPSLSPDEDQQAEQSQQRLTRSLTAESRATFFPPFANPRAGRILGIGKHLMNDYQPYIHGQLLEALNPARTPLLERQRTRQKFEKETAEWYAHLVDDERARNQVFLELQGMVSATLRSTLLVDGGAQALQRFDAVADPRDSYERTYS